MSLGAAISIKWIGFGILGLIAFLAFFEIPSKGKEKMVKIFSILFLPLFFYLFIFFLHFQLLPFSCNQKCGAVLDPYLKINYHYFNQPPKGNFFQKFIEVHKLMLAGNFLGVVNFYYQSDWYSWPFVIRPILYFKENNISIFLLPNPLIWWSSFFGIIAILYLLTRNFLFSFKMKLPPSFLFCKE